MRIERDERAFDLRRLAQIERVVLRRLREHHAAFRQRIAARVLRPGHVFGDKFAGAAVEQRDGDVAAGGGSDDGLCPAARGRPARRVASPSRSRTPRAVSGRASSCSSVTFNV